MCHYNISPILRRQLASASVVGLYPSFNRSRMYVLLQVNENTKLEKPSVNIPTRHMITKYFQSLRNKGTKEPKKNVVQLKPVVASLIIPLSFTNLIVIKLKFNLLIIVFVNFTMQRYNKYFKPPNFFKIFFQLKQKKSAYPHGLTDFKLSYQFKIKINRNKPS